MVEKFENRLNSLYEVKVMILMKLEKTPKELRRFNKKHFLTCDLETINEEKGFYFPRKG